MRKCARERESERARERETDRQTDRDVERPGLLYTDTTHNNPFVEKVCERERERERDVDCCTRTQLKITLLLNNTQYQQKNGSNRNTQIR